MASAYRVDYPSEPIGGGNPYYRCTHCKRSAPEINGAVDGHYEWCLWRQQQKGIGAHETATRDALAEYDKHDGTGLMPCPTARRMADILRNALNA